MLTPVYPQPAKTSPTHRSGFQGNLGPMKHVPLLLVDITMEVSTMVATIMEDTTMEDTIMEDLIMEEMVDLTMKDSVMEEVVDSTMEDSIMEVSTMVGSVMEDMVLGHLHVEVQSVLDHQDHRGSI